MMSQWFVMATNATYLVLILIRVAAKPRDTRFLQLHCFELVPKLSIDVMCVTTNDVTEVARFYDALLDQKTTQLEVLQ